MKKILSWPPFAFFFSKGKFKPPYFWITVFLSLIVGMVIMKLQGYSYISDELILGCLGFVAAWVGIYSWHDRRNNNNEEPKND